MASTAYDVDKEFMVIGARLDGKYQIPMMPKCTLTSLPADTVDFDGSFAKKLPYKHKEMNVHFYVDDYKYERLWNQPDKYVDHLRCFHSVCSTDFSVAMNRPFPLNLYAKYRNHAITWYLFLRGVTMIPAVGIYDKDSYDWCFDGYPKESVVSVCTNGRMRSKQAQEEFCEGFKVMCDRLEPTRVILIGRVPEKLQCDCNLTVYETRTQKINKG